MRNIHHLELFYYVARYGGISQAVRHMPYGIRQPTISSQIRQLEDALGYTLFHRHPFQLTPRGGKLFGRILPIFERLDEVTAELDGPCPKVVRLASTPLILREYLPPMLERLRPRFPAMRFVLREGSQREIDQWFEAQEIDLAINVLEGKRPAGCRVQPLIQLPLVLLVPQPSPLKSADDLRTLDLRNLRLLCLSPEDSISRGFREGLARWSIQWTPATEVNSLELVETYVRRGQGIGVSVLIPGRSWPPGVRAVSLPAFPRIKVGALWRGARDPATEAILGELRQRARDL